MVPDTTPTRRRNQIKRLIVISSSGGWFEHRILRMDAGAGKLMQDFRDGSGKNRGAALQSTSP
jgi:hypothetical protein